MAFYLENEFSKATYAALVSDSRARKCPIYPNYKELQKAITRCLPENIKGNEVEVVISLQSTLNKSAERFCESIISDCDENCPEDLTLIGTLGFDSSSGHVNAQQKCSNTNNEDRNPLQSLFVSSIIMINLRCSCGQFSWVSKTPQSIRFCRPLRIALEKEDETATLAEFARLNKEMLH